MAVWAGREGSKETSDRFSDYHLDIGAYLIIAKYSNIAGRIFESVKLSMKDRSWRVSKKRYREVFGVSPFLVTRLGLVLQAPPSQAKRKAVERLPTSLSL